MSEVHVFSLKIGASHGLWQYKARGTHERVVMHGLADILDAVCRLLRFDLYERSAVYLFTFSSDPFPDFQVKALLPLMVREHYLRQWPKRIFFKLEKSLTGGIVS